VEGHAKELVQLAQMIVRPFLEERVGEVSQDGSGMQPLPTRLMAGLASIHSTCRMMGFASATTTVRQTV
jgi:IS5 family transposase